MRKITVLLVVAFLVVSALVIVGCGNGTNEKTVTTKTATTTPTSSDDSEKPSMENIIGDVTGKKALIFDDEVASGGSLIEASEMLEKNGVTEIIAFCVHGVLSGNAKDALHESFTAN